MNGNGQGTPMRALDTAAVHAGSDPDEFHGSLSVPIYATSAFRLEDVARGAAAHEGDTFAHVYGRMGTPTQSAFEIAIAELEGGESALAFSSGMAAIASLLLSVAQSGDHIVVPTSLYTTTGSLLRELLEPAGVHVTRVDMKQARSVEAAMTERTRAVYVETPSNPTLDVVDVAAVASIARAQGALVIADNTFATPVNQQPLALGADVVVHSATKYIGGHGDLVAGVMVGHEELMHRVQFGTRRILGGAIAPHTAWLALRGVRTLPLRMERHNANAAKVAAFLDAHRDVERVVYPGLDTHPGYDVARRQMSGFGGMVSFDVGSFERARRLTESTRLITLGVSLGDVASLIQPASALSQAALPDEEKRAAGVTPGLVRLSVGIECAADLLEDLDQALERTTRRSSVRVLKEVT